MKVTAKDICFLFFVLLGLTYLINFQGTLLMTLLFGLNFLLLSFFAFYHLYLEKVYSPFLSTFIIFNYIFFFAAPITQINHILQSDTEVFIHNFPLKHKLVVRTSMFILVFNLVFFFVYDGLKKRNLYLIKGDRNYSVSKFSPVSIILLLIICFLILYLNIDFISYEYQRPEWMQSEYDKSLMLIITKVLFIFPLGAVVACKSYFVSKGKATSNLYIIGVCLVLISIALVVVKNPFITKRHDLGPILFLVIFLFFSKLINTNTKFLSLLFFSLIIGLPLAQLITHLDYGIEEVLREPTLLLEQVENGVLTDGYNSLNYDAFINVGIVIEATVDNGFSYGYQSLSGFLFFIPRSIWIDKPIASGKVVGEHLTENYDFYFQNLSNPFISEAYNNFGLLGIIIYAIVLSMFIVYMIGWLHSNDWFKKSIAFYFSLHLIFVLRGDFTSSFAYFVATFIGVYIMPKAIDRIIKSFTQKIELKHGTL